MMDTGKKTDSSFLIIGAGPCGLYLGKKLLEKGKDFQIVEKSRGVGGRVSTRRIEGEFVDHGAPYLKFSNQLLDLFLELQVPGVKIDAKGIFNAGGMTTAFKKLASTLPVSKDIKIIKIERKSDQWLAYAENGQLFEASHLIITAPLPQALDLLETSQIDYDHKFELKDVSYSKALIGLFVTDDDCIVKPDIPANVHSAINMKERNYSGKVSVIRLSENFSENNFDKPDADILSLLENFFISSCEVVGKITYRELKKWRYALPKTSIHKPFIEVSPHLYLAGDAFLYPDIRGALLSAEALAENLI